VSRVKAAEVRFYLDADSWAWRRCWRLSGPPDNPFSLRTDAERDAFGSWSPRVYELEAVWAGSPGTRGVLGCHL
jgi:hypothetical protein